MVVLIVVGSVFAVILTLVFISGFIEGFTGELKRNRANPPNAKRTPAASASSPVEAPTPTPPAQPPQPPQRSTVEPPPIAVTAEQLREDYESNDVSADDRYRGKAILMTGIVKAIRKDILDKPYVELSTSNQFMSVHARFDPNDHVKLGKFLRGDRIIVRCIGNNVVMGSPQLKDCTLQQHARRAPAPSE
jgi:hypothetical protein